MSKCFKITLIICALLLTAAGALSLHEWWLLPDGKLHIAFLDVGQGDSAFIVTPSGKQIVIDGGPDGTLLRKLGERMPLFDRSIDLLVMSHPQMDHMFSFPDVLRRYRVGHVLMTGVAYSLPRYAEFLNLVKEQRVPVWIADPAKDIQLGDGVTLDVLWPPPILWGKKMKGDVNNSSIVLRVIHGTGSVLFTGDLEESAERAVMQTQADLRATILKVGHHGSKTSSGTGFLLAVRPRLAVISCGRDNRYGHPNKPVVDRFNALHIPMRITAQEGDVDVAF